MQKTLEEEHVEAIRIEVATEKVPESFHPYLYTFTCTFKSEPTKSLISPSSSFSENFQRSLVIPNVQFATIQDAFSNDHSALEPSSETIAFLKPPQASAHGASPSRSASLAPEYHPSFREG